MTNLKKPIALIGLPGSGKTTLGEMLAKKLALKFFDIDHIITQKLNRSIDEIFAKDGEDFFRKQEKLVLKNLNLGQSDYVLSTGGGIIANSTNLKFLLDNFIVIHIKCDVEIIEKRLTADNSRPLLKGDTLDKLKFLFTQRQELYNKAHITLDTSSNDIDRIIKDSINALNNIS